MTEDTAGVTENRTGMMGTGVPEFGGRAALVTGGASGIGLATANLLAARGAAVAVLDRDISGAKGANRGIHVIEADVTDDTAVRAAVAGAVAALGGLDVLVNNAGVGAKGTVEDNADDEWHHVFDVNVFGIARTSRAAMPHLRAAAARFGQAAIVNTCSIVAPSPILRARSPAPPLAPCYPSTREWPACGFARPAGITASRLLSGAVSRPSLA